jgi:hypothetical protein
MYGLTRATLTLIGAGIAGFLLWLGANTVSGEDVSVGEHWLALLLIAAGGLTMALSQLLGGWTKWGWPRVSANVFLIAFMPVLIVGGWVLAFGEPAEAWLGDNVRSWSDDLGIVGLMEDLTAVIPAIAFAIGLVFGLTFDTTGPRSARTKGVPAAGAAHRPTPATDGDGRVEDRRVRLEDDETPAPGPGPRTREPAKK